MIEAQGLTKQYGEKVAVDNLSFTVQPGVVTGFLGENGAGNVRSPDDARLRDVLLADGIGVASSEPGHLQVTGMTSDEIGYRAAAVGLTLLELTPVQASLEEAFMALTHDAVEYRAPTPASVASRDADLVSEEIAA